MVTLVSYGSLALLVISLTVLQTMWLRRGYRPRVQKEAKSLGTPATRSQSLSHLSPDEKLQYIIEVLQQDERASYETMPPKKVARFFSSLAWNLFSVAAGWLLNSSLTQIGWH